MYAIARKSSKLFCHKERRKNMVFILVLLHHLIHHFYGKEKKSGNLKVEAKTLKSRFHFIHALVLSVMLRALKIEY